MFQRPVLSMILKRIRERRRFIQVLAGPRQTGKTTLAHQAISSAKFPCHYASADEPTLKDRIWIEQQWDIARTLLGKKPRKNKKALLVLDEVQKIPRWSETVKRLWDQDSGARLPLHVILLGSSPLLVQQGLTESLSGRFEIIPITHWSYEEMRDAFGWNLDQYIFYGGYPGASDLIKDHGRWSQYIIHSLIETTISRDILLMTRVDKPALLRRLFELGCSYSGQILSYQKMLGQLQDAGNTTTLAHYLDLLKGAGLLSGLSKYSGQKFRQRASSPKLLVLNSALVTAPSSLTLEEARKNPEFWGRLVETTVGAFLANRIMGKPIDLFYWSSCNREVDYVLTKGKSLVALEVKSGRVKNGFNGIQRFSGEFNVKKKLLVGPEGLPLEEFFLMQPEDLFE